MIEFDHASVVRGGRSVVADVSFTVAPGQAVAVLGRSDAGKSSLLEALATSLPLSAGDIRVDGHSVRTAADAVRTRLGYVPAVVPAWPRARADEWLELFAIEAGLRGKPMRQAVTQGLEMAGIAAGMPLDALSAGAAKRLLFARSLLHAPEIIVADDPFGPLDPDASRFIEDLFVDFHLGGRAVVAAVNAATVPSCFTHLAVLHAGRLRAYGPATPSAFEDDGRLWRYRMVCPASAAAAAAALRKVAVAARDVDLDTVECRHSTRRFPCGELVAAVVQAGVPVESAGFAPPWTAQLLDDE